MKRDIYTKGMIALFTSIVISTLLLFCTISLSSLVHYLNGSYLDRENKKQSKFVALACIDRVVMRILQDQSYAPQYGFGENVSYENSFCEIISVQGSENKLIRVVGKRGDAYTYLEATLNRDEDGLQIRDYREYDYF